MSDKSGYRFCRQTRAKTKGQSLSGDSVIVRQTLKRSRQWLTQSEPPVSGFAMPLVTRLRKIASFVCSPPTRG